jgi:8-oxo-dGTP diphosphatase
MEIEQKPRVGIGVTILKDGKILLGKRKGSHGQGEWASPGGHLEYMESFTECILREVAEECGLTIQNIRFQFLANMKEYAPKHYCHIGMLADWKAGEPQVLEPEKCTEWRWFDLNELPENIFVASRWAIEALKDGFIFKDAA